MTSLRTSVAAVVMLLVAAAGCGASGAATSPDSGATDAAADADAPASTCPGASLMSDARNCGRCGHDCLGGACESGQCQPYVFAEGLVTPIALAVTKSTVYLAEAKTRVTAIDRASGAKRTIASGQKFPLFISATDESITWSNGGDLESSGSTLSFVPGTGSVMLVAGGAAPVVLAKDLDSPGGLAHSSGRVFWADFNGLHSVALDGTDARVLTTGTPYGLALAEPEVFFTNYAESGAVRAVPMAGGPSRLVASKQLNPSWIAVDATHAYWTSFSTTPDAGGVYRALKAGGSVEKLATATRAYALALDDDFVYVADIEGGVYQVQKAGGIVRDLSTEPGSSIAADGKMVLWTRSGTGKLHAWVK